MKSFPTPRKFTGQEILFLSQNVILIVERSPKENKGAPVTMTGGTPICGSETEITLLHFVVFEEKIGPKVKFLTHKQT